MCCRLGKLVVGKGGVLDCGVGVIGGLSDVGVLEGALDVEGMGSGQLRGRLLQRWFRGRFAIRLHVDRYADSAQRRVQSGGGKSGW